MLKYVQNMEKEFSAKKICFALERSFALECIFSFLPFNFVIRKIYTVCEYIYSLKR